MSAGELVVILAAVAFLIWRVRRAGSPKGPAR